MQRNGQPPARRPFIRRRPARLDPPQQFDDRLFPFAAHAHVRRTAPQRVLGHRRGMFPADHDRQLRPGGANRLQHLPRQRPQRAEHAAQAHHVHVPRQPCDHLAGSQPLHQDVRPGRHGDDLVEGLAGGVDHGDAMPGLPRGRGDVGQPDGRVGRVHLQTAGGLDAGGVDQREMSHVPSVALRHSGSAGARAAGQEPQPVDPCRSLRSRAANRRSKSAAPLAGSSEAPGDDLS